MTRVMRCSREISNEEDLGSKVIKMFIKTGRSFGSQRQNEHLSFCGSPVLWRWQTAASDWPVPARMGFAVNRSQLGQSEWKEVAQRGHFVSGSALWSRGWKQNTIGRSFSPWLTCYRFHRGIPALFWPLHFFPVRWDGWGRHCCVFLMSLMI